ncbi:MAG: SRPBCC family protein, partial [Deltaproteobacteria bacterium]
MQDHSFSFEIDAKPELVWRALHPPVRNPAQPGKPRII